MKLAINFSPLKKGGGQNVALNFLSEFFNPSINLGDITYIVADNSQICEILSKTISANQIITTPQNPIKRILSEIFVVGPLLKKRNVSIIYSYFGFGFYPSSIPQVVGAADSNLFYPEVNFWSQYHGINLIYKKIIDAYRIWGLKRAAGIVFETTILEERSRKIFNFKALTRTIKPSITVPDYCAEITLPLNIKDKKKGLLLCSWQLNKNIMMIPYVCKELKKDGNQFVFIITAPADGSKNYNDFINLVFQLKVEEYIHILGPVAKDRLASLYNQIDIVFLLSKLESFSNNIIEAWYFKKPLIISDEDWSHEICKDAAAFVDRDNPAEIACVIEKVLDDVGYTQSLLDKGISNINEYPTIHDRTMQEIDFIKQVYEANN